MKPKNFLTILLSLFFLAAVTASYFFLQERKKNTALALKVKLIAQNKQKATPWHKIKEPSDSLATQKYEPSAFNDQNDENPDLDTMPTEILAKTLEMVLLDPQRQSAESLDRALKMSDELIAREPTAYSAYKSKLILLLTQEEAHGVLIDEAEVEDLLDNMAGFDILSDSALKKEAFLIARTNTEIDEIAAKTEALNSQLIGLENDLANQPEGSQVFYELISRKTTIEQQVDELMTRSEELQENLEEGLLSDADYINLDVVEIYFQRSLARGRYDEVIEQAENFIDEFRDSVTGYYYLVKALELSGLNEEALNIISKADLPEEDLRELQERLKQNLNPKDYWKRLKF